MKWGVQVVKPSTYNNGSTSVLVQFSSGRYLFNCGEGTQRLSFENKTRLSKLTSVFLTRVDWESMGGLPGMLLTLADAGTRDLVIHGGHNLTHAMAATRHFILRSDMGVGVRELRDGDAGAEYADENVRVQPVHIYPDGYTASAAELGPDESAAAATRRELLARAFGVCREPQAGRKRREPVPQGVKKGYYGQECREAAIAGTLQRLEQRGDEAAKKRVRGGSRGRGSTELLPATAPTPGVVCYVVTGPEVPGKFDPQAARALGLKPGPHYARLVKGESVVTADGTEIRPEQCVGPVRPSSRVVIVDCPTPAYVASVVESPQLAALLAGGAEAGPRLALVVHALGPGVAQDARYRAWAARFPAHVQHVVSAPEFVADNNPFQRHLRIHTALSAVDPRTYVTPQAAGSAELQPRAFIDGARVVAASSLLGFDIEPQPRLDESLVVPLLTPAEMRAKMQLDGAEPEPAAAGDEGELAVCAIGTGSSVPSIYRNVSGNVVSVRGYGGMVLDCGEATVSLLRRFLGHPQRNPHSARIGQSYDEFVRTLRLLYISHMHADHHLGAVQLLHDWSRLAADSARLTVLAPARFWAWLEDYAGVQDVGLGRLDFVDCGDLRGGSAGAAGAAGAHVARLKAGLGLAEVQTCSVVHCPWAYGVSLTHASGWKLVYSGDTRPCASLVALGRAGGTAPTIVLHEATLPDELHADAVAKRHSTVSEAVAMALGMRAENLLLTHFSQRCMVLPRWSAANIEAVSVSRYGAVASSGSSSAREDSGDEAELALPADSQAPQSVRAALERELCEAASDTDTGAARGVLGSLKVAAAFDMSVYAPSDIDRYRRNIPRLKRAMFDELKRYIDEEGEEDGDSDAMPAKGPVPKAAKGKKAGKQAA
ncbi:hypothetical protein H4R23_000684 [Coemansia sp. Cherry 401B]|nr:hypothetical protein H4R23_000684 [Coemansia sp. Cherry 401B]